MRAWLEIKLRSELCAANGDSTSGLVDTDVANEYGLPIIPAKRIKGCLREVGLELKRGKLGEGFDVLFGSSGDQHTGALHIEDAHLFEIPDVQSIHLDDQEYESVRQSMRTKSASDQRKMLDELTTLRTRTAIDSELGSASEGSLRTLRVLPSEVILRSRIELVFTSEDDAHKQDAEILLDRCAKGLRNIGLGRTRGLGEVSCQLIKEEPKGIIAHHDQENESVVDIGDEGKIEFPFRIVLEQPVLIPGNGGLYHSSANCIPGATLLGAMAGMYIARHKLGDQAHLNTDFARIFLQDGVKFGYALPVRADKVYAPCPTIWESVKNEPVAYDRSGKFTANHDQQEQKMEFRSISFYVHQEGEKLYKYEAEKEVRMHHSRPKNRNYGHPKGPDLDRNEGEFFQYTSLSQGQTFQGTLQGDYKDISMLLDCLQQQDNRLRLGRSRTAEYGRVRFEYGNPSSPVLAESINQSAEPVQIALCLLSPMLLLDRHGRAEADPELLLEQLCQELGAELKLCETRLKFGTLAGYNAKWRMPKPQLPVLEAGTTLVIEKSGRTFDQEDVKKIEFMRWGSQTGEGCGAIRILPVAKTPKEMKIVKDIDSSTENDSIEHSRFLQVMTERMSKKQIQQESLREGRHWAEAMIGPGTELGQTKLRQLWGMAKKSNEDAIDFNQNAAKFRQEVSKMKKLSTQKLCTLIVERFLEQEKTSQDFIDGYFQALIWKARERNE